MTDSRCEVGAKIRLSRKYFSDMGGSAVFTEGKTYEITGQRQGKGTVHTADIVDDSGVLRHINPDYLERAEFARGSTVKIKHEAHFYGYWTSDFADFGKPREIIGVDRWGVAEIRDDHCRSRQIHFNLLEEVAL